ncbi:MAG: transaldolase [Candidatus Hydrogenedentes bacterium]|nr:transaldolase [Candidatus Hydrogenedentota bacterium]
MSANPLLDLQRFGQSVWLDLLKRSLVASGELKRLIVEDGLRGVTSNPKIFDDAIEGSADYDEEIRTLAKTRDNVTETYEALAVTDIKAAADVLRPVYDESDGRDGYVSLEVNPHLAHDTPGTIAEARRLWKAVDKPNVFIKIPATLEGVPAIEQCLGEGININVTLLFSLDRYRAVAEAFVRAIEQRAKNGQTLARIESVASFFLSRVDVLVDSLLDKQTDNASAKDLRGKAAIASAKMAYQIYKEIFESDAFKNLAAKGARSQRVLWASTGTKDPKVSDVKYVEALIGPETVNTMPLETLNAYRDHGKPASRLEQGIGEARDILNELAEIGIDMDAVSEQLEKEGVKKFNEPFDKLLKSLESKRAKIC